MTRTISARRGVQLSLLALAVAGGAAAGWLAESRGLLPAGAVLAGLAAAVFVLSDARAGLWAVLGVVTLLPFAVIPAHLKLTPTLLEVTALAAVGVWLLKLLLRRDERIVTAVPGAWIVLLLAVTLFAFLLGVSNDYMSGEPIASRVRARKSPEEQRRVAEAVATTVGMWDDLRAWLRPGVTERQVADFLHGKVEVAGIGTSWDARYCPAVSAGPRSPVGHVGPTDIPVGPGELLSVDFGVKQDDYTSDLQRTFYFLAPGEREAPEPVRRAFAVISEVIQTAAHVLRPGVAGWEVDEVAREIFERERYEPWAFALGHQLGRACHDGGTVLGPQWERYGQRPFGRVEKDEVYTLEIGVSVPGYGRVSLEEDVVVTADGCRFLAEPQRGPILVG